MMKVAGKKARASAARVTTLAVLVGLALMGCGTGNNGVTPGPTPSANSEFVFIPNAQTATGLANNVMSVLVIGSNGSFNNGPVPLVTTGFVPVWSTVDPTNHFVYVTNFADNTVSAFTLNSITGAMAAVNGQPFPAGTNPGAAAVDPTGKFLYVANDGSNNVSGYKINSNGSLTQVPGSPVAAGTQPQQGIAVTNRFIYVSNQLTNDVSAYSFDSGTGALTPLAGSPFTLEPGGVGPESLAMDPAGKFLFTANMNSNNVSAFTVNADGSLTAVPGSPFPAGDSPQYLVTNRNGSFLYVVNVNDNTVTAYSIGSNGALSALATSLTGFGPEGLTVDSANNFVLVANCGDGTLSVFGINSNGTLTGLTPLTVGGCPQAVATTH
jgi:6-phosphogluconolactonase